MSPSPLVDLPDVVLRNIQTHLDRPSGIALATTCRALQAVGERSAWKQLNLSISSLFDHLSPPSITGSVVAPLSPRMTKKLFGRCSASPLELRAAHYELSITKLSQYLESHPQFMRAVRSIVVDDGAMSFTDDFCDMLMRLAPRLTHLTISRPYLPAGLLGFDGQRRTLEDIFTNLPAPLLSLTHLDLSLPSEWQTRLGVVLKRTPNLRSLRLSPQYPFCNGWSCETQYASADSDRAWPILDQLVSLEIDGMSNILAPFVAWVLSTSPRLTHMDIRNESGLWRVNRRDPLFQQIAESFNLRPFALIITVGHNMIPIRRMPFLEWLNTKTHRNVGEWSVTELSSRAREETEATRIRLQAFAPLIGLLDDL